MAINVWDHIIDHFESSLLGIDGSADASSNVNQNSAAGQNKIYLASLASFEAGQAVAIAKGTVREEAGVINSVESDHLALLRNLTYDHDAADTDVAKQGWYNYNVSRLIFWPGGPPPWTGDVPEVAISDDKKYTPENLMANKTRWWRNVGIAMVAHYQPSEDGKEASRAIADVVHDLTRAVHSDHTRGNYAADCRIQEAVPSFPSEGLVAVEMLVAVLYGHQYNDTARKI